MNKIPRITTLTGLALVIAFSACDNPTVPRDKGIIPDPHFEAVIREALGMPTGEITPEDLLEITRLIGSDDDITDIIGIEYCVGGPQMAPNQ